VNRLLISAVLAGSFVGLSACGGSSGPPAGQAQAQAACQSQDPNLSAQDAAAAAKLNSRFSTLSVDAAARAASARTQENELSDGSSSDDTGLGALAGADTLGQGGGIKVLTDCVGLGLKATP
jgi:hypothetical protein